VCLPWLLEVVVVARRARLTGCSPKGTVSTTSTAQTHSCGPILTPTNTMLYYGTLLMSRTLTIAAVALVLLLAAFSLAQCTLVNCFALCMHAVLPTAQAYTGHRYHSSCSQHTQNSSALRTSAAAQLRVERHTSSVLCVIR
jgi:hypothetical protein